MSQDDKYTIDIQYFELNMSDNNNAFHCTKRSLKSTLLEHAVANVLAMKREHSSLSSMPQPRHWFRFPININNSSSAEPFIVEQVNMG